LYTKLTRKRQEIFFNQTLAFDEIDRLFDAKAFSKFSRYTADGKQAVGEIKRHFDGTPAENLIIKGNNLIALHSLAKQFKGKVKLIYIDPPYNTGNDGFKYNDKFNHSTWLTFMKNRLEIAKTLLADDGVIFVHCDKNEFAYLKVLMDEVLDRENYIETITVVNNPRGRDYGGIANMHEYIHVYAKHKTNYELYKVEDPNKEFPYKDEIGGYEVRELRNRNTAFHMNNRPNLCYPFFVNPNKEIDNGFLEISLTPEIGFIEVMPAKSMGIQTVWRWGKEKSAQNLNINLVGKKMKEEGRYMIVEKYRESKRMERSVWWDREVNSERGTIHLRELFGEKIFSFPKPEELMKRIIQIATNPNDIVLDYHLGSGTTAAVAHKMNRQYIGIEQMDYIETLAVERLKKVIKGEKGGISKAVNWQGGGEFVYAELAPFNETAKQQILACENSDDIKTLFNELCERYFLKYNVSVKEFSQIIEQPEFQSLPLDEQKQMVLEMLDLNQMYVSLSEMDDEQFADCLNDDDKALSRAFYQSVKNQAEKKDGE
ncbi:TPA: site-specific DNA-methyltransferase, partial [Haemophilus influenzae]